MTNRDSMLEKIAAGDKEAIAHLKLILKFDGAIEKDNAPAFLNSVIEGMISQNGMGPDGVKMKFELFSLVNKLNSILVPSVYGSDDKEIKALFQEFAQLSEDEMEVKEVVSRAVLSHEGSVEILEQGMSAFNEKRALLTRKMLELGIDKKIMAISDNDIQLSLLYEDLVAIAMNGPKEDLEGLGKGFLDAVNTTTAQSFRQVISVGAALVRASEGEIALPKGFVQTATKSLIQAAKYAPVYDKIDSDTNEVLYQVDIRGFAIEALKNIAVNDAQVRRQIAEIAQSAETSPTSKKAGIVMAAVRLEDESDSARADKEFLIETEYPDYSKPQRLYVECIFQAIETVFKSPQKTSAEKREYEVAVLQLATGGADPGQIELLFESKSDKSNAKIIMRNVENALLHALTNGHSPQIKERAAQGLERIGSERVEFVLDKIVERNGESSQVGAIASEALSAIRGKKVWETAEEISIVRPKADAQVRRPLQKLANS